MAARFAELSECLTKDKTKLLYKRMIKQLLNSVLAQYRELSAWLADLPSSSANNSELKQVTFLTTRTA
jgi:hypothetical protein